MTRVELIGTADDGENIVVVTESGERYTLPVTESLRTVIGAAGAHQAEPATMSPKDIQRRVRAGQSAEEISAATGVPVEKLRAYEGPVLAEREYIAQLARNTRTGRETGAPHLGEVVTDRLSSRGIAAAKIEWDAWRSGSNPWCVSATYPLAGGSARAVWTFDHATRTVRAQDDEARWLTETDVLDMPAPTRHLAPVRHEGPAPEVSLHKLEAPAPAKKRTTDELLAELQAKRGTREEVVAEELDASDEEFEGFGPQQYVRRAEVRFESNGGAVRQSAGQDEVVTAEEPAPAPRRTGRKGRTSVPTWDEIVFGAKSD